MLKNTLGSMNTHVRLGQQETAVTGKTPASNYESIAVHGALFPGLHAQASMLSFSRFSTKAGHGGWERGYKEVYCMSTGGPTEEYQSPSNNDSNRGSTRKTMGMRGPDISPRGVSSLTETGEQQQQQLAYHCQVCGVHVRMLKNSYCCEDSAEMALQKLIMNISTN